MPDRAPLDLEALATETARRVLAEHAARTTFLHVRGKGATRIICECGWDNSDYQYVDEARAAHADHLALVVGHALKVAVETASLAHARGVEAERAELHPRPGIGE